MLVDFEKLRMAGAGKAIAVLTSGGDAQGKQIKKQTKSYRLCIIYKPDHGLNTLQPLSRVAGITLGIDD